MASTNGHVSGSSRPMAEPLAIVGMACRFAGGTTSPEKLWEFVSEGRSAWSEIPATRFNQSSFYHPQSDKSGTTHIMGGYFLEEDVGLFDPSFFNLSSDVVATMDPQIRLLLELTFESLESAGIPIQDIAGSNTSVYAGSFAKDYHDIFLADSLHIPPVFVTGNYAAMAANRISHFFDLRGPSTAVDTGCSTSLVGLHLACQSLRSGESDCAIVGGACINVNPDFFVNVSSLGFCGPDGKCYSFDHRAQGYGRGEGVAVLMLKRLDDALKNGDPIRAVIRDTALNQDGKTATITSPDFEAQRSLISSCYERCGLNPLETALVEAHGTGTPAGDPIEANAIGVSIGQGRPKERPLYLASIKSNIGHTEAASGLAAIIKMAKSLELGQIAPSINFEKPNPDIDLQTLGLKIPRELMKWPCSGVRRGSVNNFGYGGTNAHVIMEASDHYNRKLNGVNGVNDTLMQKLFILSARDEKTATRVVTNLREHIQKANDISLGDLAYTLGQRRSKFSWSVGISAGSLEELEEALSDNTLRPTQAHVHVPRLGLVFNGQGAQWFAMGRELMAAYPTFLNTLDECDAILKALGAEWSIVEELKRNESTSRVNEVRFSMPLSCAVQLALVKLMEDWTILPTAVTGHSTGEVAAAFAAGALDLGEAMAITYFRGLINAEAIKLKTSSGSMLAVGLGPEEVELHLDSVESGKVTIACFNSPSSVTLSGDTDTIGQLDKNFASEGIFARKLKVQAAFHSHHMIPLQKEYRHALKAHMGSAARVFAGNVAFFSPVTGNRVTDASQLGPEHWVTNMLEPVRFTQSFREMVLVETESGPERNVDIVIEVGPHSALAGPIRQSLTDPVLKSISYGSCLERGKNAVFTMQTCAGLLVQKGCALDMARVNFPTGSSHCRVIPNLPSYPWNHSTRFWSESRASREHRFREHPPHELLGVRLPGTSNLSPIWRLVLKANELPWVHDHKVHCEIVYPGSGYVCMAIEAIRQLEETHGKVISGYTLRDINILKALIIPETSEGIEVQLFLEPPIEGSLVQGWRQFRIYSSPNSGDPWIQNAHGFIAANFGEAEQTLATLTTSTELNICDDEYPRSMNPKILFGSLHKVGVAHGPIFQNLNDIRTAKDRATATITVADVAATMPHRYQQQHVVHPIVLDSVFQAVYPALSPKTWKEVGASVPRSIKSLYISASISNNPGTKMRAYGHLLHHNLNGFNAEACVLETNDGKITPVIKMEDMHFQSLGGAFDSSQSEHKQLCLVNSWISSLSLNDVSALAESLKAQAPPDEVVVARDLARVTYNFVHDVLGQLTEEDISNLEWYHKRLYDWMLMLEGQAQRNELAPESSGWADTSEVSKFSLMEKVEKASVNGELAVRMGKNVLNILRKEVTPLELMLQGQLLYRFYHHVLHFTRSTLQAARVVRSIADENPRIRILEIGAGTAACTVPVLDALSSGDGQRFDQYDFTDISAGFFQASRERLSSWGDMVSFSTLDIEKDPEGQGFQPGSYDVVIAAQVLHATKDMMNTMRNVRKLLKDGGKLVLVETTRDTPEMHLIFGLLPSWWLSEEPERKLNPNMSLEAWDKYLRDTGFTGLDMDVWDCEDPEHQAMSCIMSSAVSTQQPDFEEDITILYSDSIPPSEWTEVLAEKFSRETGITPTLTSLEGFDASSKACIFLSGLQGVGQSFDESSFASIKALVTVSKSLLWVTYGSQIDCQVPENAIHLGLLRTARLEDKSKRYVSLDLDPGREPWTLESADAIVRIFQATMDRTNVTDDRDMEYAQRDSVILIPRIHADTEENDNLFAVLEDKEPEMQPFVQPGRELRMHVNTPGLLDSMIFKDNEAASLPLPDGWVEIEPRAFGLNFRDVMTAMGMMKGPQQKMGPECAGVVTRVGGQASLQHDLRVGDRVCAFAVHGNYANHARAQATSVVRIPDSISFEAGASIVITFLTAYFSLFWAGRADAGDAVLIHAAAGGVGQACVILAQWKGLEIFATVGSQEKREFLTATYGIPSDHIFSSRDSSFAGQILQTTRNRGVDIVINSLAGKLLDESWNLLAPLGRFIEIGKRDIHQNKLLEMEPFQKALSFTHVDVGKIAESNGALIQKTLQKIVNLLDQNVIQNISPIVTYPIADISRAFRTMQAGNHIGKIVLIPSPHDMVKATRPRELATLDTEATYMVVGGLTGIGLSVARLLAGRGARNLLLVSRNATSRREATIIADELGASGCMVTVKDCDVGDAQSLESTIRECYSSGLPPIKGVVHGGMVLEDSILERMTYSQWLGAMNPKLQGTKNIDRLFGDSLDFYIMLSSTCGVLGNTSQANYAAGNTFQDAVARHRAAKGQAAVSIDLGPVQSVGYVAGTVGIEERLLKAGHGALSEAEVLGLIEYAIRRPRRTVLTSQVASGLVKASHTNPRLALLRERLSHRTSSGHFGKRKEARLNDQIAQTETAGEAIAVVQQAIVAKISDMFVLQQADIDPAQPLSRYGVDSLVAVELRNWLVSNARIEMSIFHLLGCSSLTELARSVVKRSKAAGSAAQP